MSTFTRFQKLRSKAPTAWLGHVFVGILAIASKGGREVVAERINEAIGGHLEEVADGCVLRGDASDIAEVFHRLLELPPSAKPAMVRKIDAVLADLCRNDFFGTEGQCDPRGDHR